jgi:hypothetical protein
MTTSARESGLSGRAQRFGRWPTVMGVIAGACAIAAMALLGDEVRYFGPSVATMAGIYLVAYAVGRPWTAWPAFIVLSAFVTALYVLQIRGVLPFGVATGMTVVLVLLWLWSWARGCFRDISTFSLQTAGMVGFGLVALVSASADPRLGTALAGVGFLAHGAWDAYHFKLNAVVHRSWSEFCAVVDLLVGVALIVVAVRG